MVQTAAQLAPVLLDDPIVYPDSDGEPMAENTKQYRYIVTIQPELESLFADDPNVFVAADLFWYPVKERPDLHYAPDTMVVFGRPKGDRGSYKQWEEAEIAPQVVFEIISPGNTWPKMVQKRRFYERYGVEEYYEYDPDDGLLEIWQREGHQLRPVAHDGEWRSLRLGITLKLEPDGALSLYRPDRRKFLTPVEQETRAREAEERATRAEQTNERLAAKLRELGIDPATLREANDG